ncbi:MAG: DJ-1 family protein [Tissierellia bacterium]|nr:DJ-1 family protein [Tissierellia bacterium]
MDRIIVFLADGFEEIEALTQVDFLRRVDDIEVDMVTINGDLITTGAHGIKILADKMIDDIDISDYTGLVLPGGWPGADNLRNNKKVVEIVRKFYEEDKLVAAICAAPIVLAKAEIIDGKNITSYPGFEDDLKSGKYSMDSVVVDGNIITARGPAMAGLLAYKIVEYLKGKEISDVLKADTLQNLL